MTGLAILILLIGAGVVEGIALWRSDDQHHTITQVTRRVVKKHPIIIFLAGLICGHLFWCGNLL